MNKPWMDDPKRDPLRRLLRADMQGLGSKVSSAEHELKTKMDALVTSEAAHDANQERKIAAITASLGQGAARVQVCHSAHN
jgi:hypothetical protein